MVHYETENLTPFAFDALFCTGRDAEPLLVAVAKVTLVPNVHGQLVVAEKQVQVSFSGELQGAPDCPTYKIEPDTAWVKPNTDVVLIGTAHAPRKGTRVLDVGFRVGPVQQIARVFGERVWTRDGLATDPLPFERIPLLHERAYGGLDRGASKDASREPRNPAGVGYYGPGSQPRDGDSLPNIEDPRALIRSPRDRPEPAAFGFLSSNFAARTRHAGTYDERWLDTRAPFLPMDFDERFFNAAPPTLQVHGRLRGDEPVHMHHLSSEPERHRKLPGPISLTCEVSRRHGDDAALTPELDTVIVNSDDDQVVLVYRAKLRLGTGPQDLRSLRLRVVSWPSAWGLPPRKDVVS